MNLISLFITGLLTENVILSKFLGLCPFMGSSNKEKKALYMGLSVTIIVMISSIMTYLIYKYILIPTNTTYLRTIMFILIIAFMVQLVELVLKKFLPKVHKSLGIYLPLITTNCAVLGITLLNINNGFSFKEVIVYSLGSSLGFTLVIYIFASIRERLQTCNVPKYFKDVPIALITASIMALLFMRYIPS